MNNKKILPLVVVIFVTVSLVTGGLVYFAYNISSFTTFSMDTTVANVYIGGKNYDKSYKQLKSEVNNWNEQATITLSYQGVEKDLNTDIFDFRVKYSLDHVEDRKHNSLDVNIYDEQLEIFLRNEFTFRDKGLLLIRFLDMRELKRTLIAEASELTYSKTIDLGTYIDDYEGISRSINKTVIQGVYSNTTNTTTIAKKASEHISEIKIEPKEQFSLLTYLETNLENPKLVFTSDELDIVGSGIYSLILETNFSNIHKVTSREIPAYYNNLRGYETDISYEKQTDLTFYNPNPYPLYIEITSNNNDLIFTLKGPQFVHDIFYEYDKVVMPPKTISRYVNYVTGVDGIVAKPGKDGYRIIIKRVSYGLDGNNLTDTELKSTSIITEEIYMPEPIIVERQRLQN